MCHLQYSFIGGLVRAPHPAGETTSWALQESLLLCFFFGQYSGQHYYDIPK
jgi:hypothetical protein